METTTRPGSNGNGIPHEHHEPHPDPDRTEHQRELLVELYRELWSAERAAHEHADRQARLLGPDTAGDAMRALAEHAELTLREMRDLARVEALPGEPRLGGLVTLARHTAMDHVLDRAHSYRAALLDVRATLDITRMLRFIADASGRVAIAGFCTRLLHERERLVTAAEHGMSWFAHHPAAAVARPTMRSWIRSS